MNTDRPCADEPTRSRSLACRSLVSALCLCSAAASAADPAAGQQMLDFMATFPLPDTTSASGGSLPIPAGAYSSWSDEERRSVPIRLAGRCTVIWVMAHDAPGTRFLPASAPESDEEELGRDLCLAGHLPADWPGRALAIAAARRILDRSNELGSSLKMPDALMPR